MNRIGLAERLQIGIGRPAEPFESGDFYVCHR